MRRVRPLRIWFAAPTLAFCLVLAGGCGSKAQEEPAKQEIQEIDKEKLEDSKAPASEGESREEEKFVPRDLTFEELRIFTYWINQGNHYGNYGFLLSEYERAEDADLNEILYSGAGMETEALSPEEEAAYLEATGGEEIYTDCTKFTTEQLEDFLQERLGLSLADMTRPLEWTYLPEHALWVCEHGDTNYMNFTCVSGRQTAPDIYELDCVPGDGEDVPWNPSCRFVLQEWGEGCRPVSNTFVEGLEYSREIWKIEEQTFEVNLGSTWGDVIFTSYAPDNSAFSNKDVTFSLVRAGEEIYRFPAVEEGDYRQDIFCRLLAVSFQDYDLDGKDDIIIIAEYQPDIYSEEGELLMDEVSVYPEVRLYKSCPWPGEFQLDQDRMDYLNLSGNNHSIAQVMEHIDDEIM